MSNPGIAELAPSCLPELEAGCKDGGLESAACGGGRLGPRWSSQDGKRPFKLVRQHSTNDEGFSQAGMRAQLQGEKERCCNCVVHQNSSHSCVSDQRQSPVDTEMHETREMGEYVNHSTQDLSHHDSCSDAMEEMQTMNLLSDELYRKANFVENEENFVAESAKPVIQTNSPTATPPYKKLFHYRSSVSAEKHRSNTQHLKSGLGGVKGSASAPVGHRTSTWDSAGLHALHQSGVAAPLPPLQGNEQAAELTPEGSVISICQGNGDRASAKATDFVVGCLCEHILRQQWNIKVQEARLQIQQERLRELEDLLSSLQAQQEFKQQQHPPLEEGVWHLKLSGPTGAHCFEGFVEASSPQPEDHMETACTPRPETESVCNAAAEPPELGNSLAQTRNDRVPGSRRSEHRKKTYFCCF